MMDRIRITGTLTARTRAWTRRTAMRLLARHALDGRISLTLHDEGIRTTCGVFLEAPGERLIAVSAGETVAGCIRDALLQLSDALEESSGFTLIDIGELDQAVAMDEDAASA